MSINSSVSPSVVASSRTLETLMIILFSVHGREIVITYRLRLKEFYHDDYDWLRLVNKPSLKLFCASGCNLNIIYLEYKVSNIANLEAARADPRKARVMMVCVFMLPLSRPHSD